MPDKKKILESFLIHETLFVRTLGVTGSDREIQKVKVWIMSLNKVYMFIGMIKRGGIEKWTVYNL